MSLQPTQASIRLPFPQDNDMITVERTCRCARQPFARMHGSCSCNARERPDNARYIYVWKSADTHWTPALTGKRGRDLQAQAVALSMVPGVLQGARPFSADVQVQV